MTNQQFNPPSHLSPRAKSLWRSIVPSRAKSASRLALLQCALESLDRADSAREVVAREGMLSKTKSTGALHVNPLVKVERESRQQFARIWGEMHLGFDPHIDGVSTELAMKRIRENTDDALAELGKDSQQAMAQLAAMRINDSAG
jgi:P27 family predicted phage terminase small subunit